MNWKDWNRDEARATLEELEVQGEELNYQRLETVLVVEDQRELNRALALRLTAEGLNVASAYDGITGLDKVRELEPDLIVLDLRLPRLHGFKLLHAVRNQWNLEEAPIVVLTGDPDPEIDKRAAGWGIRRVFRKPVDLREVVREVLATLDR